MAARLEGPHVKRPDGGAGTCSRPLLSLTPRATTKRITAGKPHPASAGPAHAGNSRPTASALRATLGAVSTNPPAPISLTAAHRRRLRELWRSAGWPCHDLLELDLLAAGLLQRLRDDAGRETLRVTDSGITLLAQTRQRNRAAFDAHEALVARVVLEMQRAGRITWRGLRLRAPPPADADTRHWPQAMPDVYSIRHTTVEDWVEPIVHEVKVRRADLLADLRHEAKRAAYLALSSQCWYVLQAGIGTADDVPAECGVMLAHDQHFEVLRAAPRRPLRLPLAAWMALARANAEAAPDDDGQGWLGAPPQALEGGDPAGGA